MTEERRQILEMLAEGKISADEADRLIGALGGSSATATATTAASAVQTNRCPSSFGSWSTPKTGGTPSPST